MDLLAGDIAWCFCVRKIGNELEGNGTLELGVFGNDVNAGEIKKCGG